MESKWLFAVLITAFSCIAQGDGMKLKKNFVLTSSAFVHKGNIPAKYSCDGEDISPALRWENAPEGTQSFVLIVDDPDAPKKIWVHWVLFNIPATVVELPEGVKVDYAGGATDFPGNKAGQYGGPCPPSGIHHYHFTLYALDTKLNLAQGATKEELLAAMQGHVLGKAELIGLYKRSK